MFRERYKVRLCARYMDGNIFERQSYMTTVSAFAWARYTNTMIMYERMKTSKHLFCIFSDTKKKEINHDKLPIPYILPQRKHPENT